MNRFSPTHSQWIPLWIILFVSLLSNSVQGQSNTLPESIPHWPTNPYWETLGIDPGLYETPYKVSLFKPKNGEDGARVWSQTKSIFFYGLGVVAVLAVMPEEMTGWDNDSDILSKWVENVTEGPVWDRDNWAYNYIGHTYSGGVYYQVARKSGYRQWDSFIYSTLMSTFYWEYGVEAFAETPSIQDLAVTPLMGWVYGEWAYQTELKVRDNHNRVAGSKALGETCLFFLDPIDSLGRGVNRVVGRRWINAGSGYFSYTAAPDGLDTDHTIYLNMRFPISGTTEENEPTKTIRLDDRNDPVNSGIVGFSLGGGHTILDEKWGMEDDFYTKMTLGLYFTPSFSARLGYAVGTVTDQISKQTVDYENYSLDFQYYLLSKQKLRPFITAGFGEQVWEKDNDLTSYQWNAGMGLHWKLHPKWALQTDWVNYYNLNENTYDQNINTTLVYRFGQGEHSNW